MQMPLYAIVNGVKTVIRPQAILTEMEELYRRWCYWSDGFRKKNKPADRMTFEFNPRTRRLNIKFKAGNGNKAVYPTDRESYFLFDLDCYDGVFLECFLAVYNKGWMAFMPDIPMVNEKIQILNRPEVDTVFKEYPAYKLEMLRQDKAAENELALSEEDDPEAVPSPTLIPAVE